MAEIASILGIGSTLLGGILGGGANRRRQREAEAEARETKKRAIQESKEEVAKLIVLGMEKAMTK